MTHRFFASFIMMSLFVVFAVVLSMSSVKALSGQLPGTGGAGEYNWVELPEAGELFREAGVEGTFVLCGAAGDTAFGFNRERAEKRFVPASTFKIFNALIGLSAGSVKNAEESIPWNGQPQPVEDWERDMNLDEAMRASNVPAYQELARRTGLSAMRGKITGIGYGNNEIGRQVDRFWLGGPLKISALEQARLLARLTRNDLPFPPETMAAVRDMVKLEEGPGWTLYSKTGTDAKSKLGWWVGWVERWGENYVFALNLDLKNPEDAAKRAELGRAALKAMGIIDR